MLVHDSGLEIAGATLWGLACLMAFLKSIQFGLMSRQAGPVIIRYDIFSCYEYIYAYT